MFVRTASAEFFHSFANLRRAATLVFATFFIIASSLAASAAASDSRYAAYVIDAKTGQVLFAKNADKRRFPASLTKMMTIYLLFEAMKTGRVSPQTQIPVSARAAAEPPTKLGVRAGGSVSVDTAIKSLVTRSANDIATAVAEYLGGSEDGFARMMTNKARQLGMTGTQYRNAHGLPNPNHWSTARDQAILGIALREHFPQYYRYFSVRSFQFGKQSIHSHNRLLGKLEGSDGIKTGYTRASGFNIATSVQRDGRSIVVVVMGGSSAASRDQHVAALVREYFPKASRKGGGGLVSAPRPGKGEAPAVASLTLPKRDIPTPYGRPDMTGEMQVAAYAEPETAPAVAAVAAAMPKAPAAERITPPAEVPVPVAAPAPEDRFPVDAMSTASIQNSGWAVQIASSTSQKEALAALVRAGKDAPGIVSDANAFIEEFQNKGTLYYRARFGFNSKNQAVNACNALKKKKIDCFTAAL